MSFFHIVNMKFLLCNEFIDKIKRILAVYKVLITNRYCVDNIKSLISNWKRSSIPVEIKENMIEQNVQNLKMQDATCNSIEKLDNMNNTYSINKCTYLIQNLIDTYTINVNITKTTLENLLPIIELLVKIDSVAILPSCRLTFVKKITYIAQFLKRNFNLIIYRETYFAYLKEEMHKKLSKVTTATEKKLTLSDDSSIDIRNISFNILNNDNAHDDTLVDHITIDSNVTVPKMTKLFSDIQDVFLAKHVTNLTEINSLRAVSMDFYNYYDVVTVKKIAIKNLESIIKNVFMLDSIQFFKLLERCGAIISGSVTEQIIHGALIDKDSDIDIYVPVSNVDISRCLIDFIFDADYSRVEETQPVMADDTHYVPRNLVYRFNHSIEGVVTLKHKTANKKIQIISIANTDGMTTYEFGQFVVSSFDFTFLKNFYDGTTLYTFDFPGIVKKCGSISPYVTQKMDLNSYPKLKGLFPVQFWYSATMATLTRVIKYKSRGYQIDNIPQFSLVKQLNL